MGTKEVLKSLAGTGKVYWPIQARVKDHMLHIQGRGPSVNRAYGVAVDVTAPKDLIKWVSNNGKAKSFASSTSSYVLMQARVSEGGVHVQAKGPKLNREYGVSFSLQDEKLDGFLATALKSASEPAPEPVEEVEKKEATNAKLD